MKSLLLKFAGPLQSWGTNSHFTKMRNTDFYPSKSAVIGMIAAAFGYKREECTQDAIRHLNDLDFAVRVDRQGTLMRDYHMVHEDDLVKKSKPQSFVTERYYLEDSIFLVAIGSELSDQITAIHKALQHPYFQLSLGRRSLPPTADFIIGVEQCGVIQALYSYPWLEKKQLKNPGYSKNQKTSIPIYADADLVEEYIEKNPLIIDGRLDKRPIVRHVRQDFVQSFSYTGRKFGPRYEAKLEVPLLSIIDASVGSMYRDQEVSQVCKEINSEHDAFANLNGAEHVSQ